MIESVVCFGAPVLTVLLILLDPAGLRDTGQPPAQQGAGGSSPQEGRTP